MATRARPPDDISPLEFFTRWVPGEVEADAERRALLGARLGDRVASISFLLEGEGGGEFTLELAADRVAGAPGRIAQVDLEVRVDLVTWRALNRGDLSAPEALLRRRMALRGDLALAIHLHGILG